MSSQPFENLWEYIFVGTVIAGDPPILDWDGDPSAEVPQVPVTFNSKHAHLLFETKECLRADTSTCYSPSHPYFVDTNTGLDVLLRKFVEEVCMGARAAFSF